MVGIGAFLSVFFFRRVKGLETDIELKVIPKFTSDKRKIRLLRKIATGSFGVVWKGKYEGETVAVKLVRVDKMKGDDSLKMAKMVCDEAIIM